MVQKIKILIKRYLKFSGNSNSIGWKGNYKSWQEVAEKCKKGFQAENILDKVSDALIKVRNGEAEYERDSYLFYTPDYNWSLIGLILKAFISKKSPLHIIDFGGSLGSSYFQNKKMLNGIPFQWVVVEQSHYVKRGKELFETEQLKFSYSFKEVENDDADIIILSSVLQYLPDPKEFINQAIAKKPEYIYVDRTSFVESQQELFLVQDVPAGIYKALLPCRFFIEKEFLSFFQHEYVVISNVENTVDKNAISEYGKKLYWKGFIMKRNI